MTEKPTTIEDDDFDFAALRSKGQKLNDAKNNLDKLLTVSLGQVNEVREKLLNNAHGAVLFELKRRRLEYLQYSDISRIQLLLEGLSNESMLDYRTYFNTEYQLRDPASVEKPKHELAVQKMTSEQIKAFNALEREYKAAIDEITVHNNKVNAINYTLTKFIDEINYGDASLDLNGLKNVYYRFNINDMEDYTKTFIKDVQMYNPALFNKVVRITIEPADLSQPMYPNETPDPAAAPGANLAGVLAANTTNVAIPIEEEDDEEPEDDGDFASINAFAGIADIPTDNDSAAGVYDSNGALDVKFWFATLEDAAEFEGSREGINQVYEKYIRYYRQR